MEKLNAYLQNSNTNVIYIEKINSEGKSYFEQYRLIPIRKLLKEYTLEELKTEFNDIEPYYIKAVYDYLHRNKYTTCENIAQKYHLSRATLYRIIDKIKQRETGH